ncbi:discoidin domain-containing protein [Kitasatospora sp. NPDC088346]|uniref:discoidin domain-containing protein n=1 Tax=Kitasatospora sp. NPDC088346 TaxID=3364073 RepID=UPI0037FB4542
MFRRTAVRRPVEGRSPQHEPASPTPSTAAHRARTGPTDARRLVTSLAAALALLAGSAALAPSAAVADPPLDPAHAPYAANDAPVLIALGQSNAASATQMSNPDDVAKCGNFTHVKGLKRTDNRMAGALNATWAPYTCAGTNMGADIYPNSYSVASLTALRWEQAIKDGQSLPDLYVIHVAWGGQGIQEADAPNNRWWPDRDQSDRESLHQLTLNTISNSLRALRDAGKTPRIIGMHWNQWEQEAHTGVTATISASHMQQAFRNVLDPLQTITGTTGYPVFLYRPRSTTFDATATQHVTDALTALANLPAPNPYRLIDPALATTATGTPLYDPSAGPMYGIFQSDRIHYTQPVQEWFAAQQWNSVFTDGRFGAPVAGTSNAALGRPTTQSSTFGDDPGAAASRAVDGNTDATNLSQTKLDTNAWWQVKLVGQLPIRGVRILNRTDDCCKARLSNFYLIVSATDLTGLSWADIQASPDPRIKRIWVKGTAPNQITLPVGVTGRYVRIQLAGTNYLALPEVLVDVPTPAAP